MLDYLVTSRARRELLRLVWGEKRSGSVSELARAAKVNFSAAHRELEGMFRAGLVATERRGAELLYRQAPDHPQAQLLRELAQASRVSAARPKGQLDSENEVRGWLSRLGAPLPASDSTGPLPPVEKVVADALVLAHSDATVARVLPLLLWRQRDSMCLERLVEQATKQNEGQALGYFLEMAGRLGKDPSLVNAAKLLVDRRRRRPRMFFSGPHGRHAIAAARARKSPVARRWGYLMNADEASYQSLFDKFATA
jgi:DNA-binding transcriptional ArsR family regulator